MNLGDFFNRFFNLSEDKHYYEFYKYFVKSLSNLNYEVIDADDLITKWREKLYPRKDWTTKDNIEFTLLSYWLYKNEFIVEGHPDLLKKIKLPKSIAEGELYTRTKKAYGTKVNGVDVTWSNRRNYIDGLQVERGDRSVVIMGQDLDEIMSLVSPRNAEFAKMELNEKLANIRDTFEYIGKIGKNYEKIPFESLSNDYITNQAVFKFQDELQCFRHGKSTMVAKRDSYTDDQKKFFVDFGLIILKIAHRFLSNLKNSV